MPPHPIIAFVCCAVTAFLSATSAAATPDGVRP